mgnify:CR=1 FL=1
MFEFGVTLKLFELVLMLPTSGLMLKAVALEMFHCKVTLPPSKIAPSPEKLVIVGGSVTSDNNTSTDNVVVTDDSGETTRYTSSSYCGTSPRCYKGRYSYNSQNSDGAVIGPYTGSDFRIFVDLGGTSTIDNSSTLTLGNLDSFKYFSKDNSSFSLGNIDNFTVGFNTTMDCSN